MQISLILIAVCVVIFLKVKYIITNKLAGKGMKKGEDESLALIADVRTLLEQTHTTLTTAAKPSVTSSKDISNSNTVYPSRHGDSPV